MKMLMFALLFGTCLLAAPVHADKLSGKDFDDYFQQALIARGVANSTAGFAGAVLDPDPIIRRYAVLALGERGDPAGIPALVSALSDSMPTVRFYAAGSLVQLRSNAGAAVLRDVLATAPDARQAVEAGGLLAELGELQGYPKVVAALGSGDTSLELAAISALAKFYKFENEATPIGPVRVVDKLAAVIDGPSVALVKVNSIYLLGRTGSGRAVAALSKAASDPDQSISTAAQGVLTQLKRKQGR